MVARWRPVVREGLRDMYPGYFALVMATGIVSNAFYYLDHDALSDVLFGITLAAFPLLLACFVVRVLMWPRAVWRDLVDPRLVFTFFTLVAASDVLGLQLHLRGHDHVALVLWLAGLSAWLLLGYFSFAVLTFDEGQTGADVVHGGWLIAIVGTESLVLLGAPLAGEFGSLQDTIFVAVYALWGIGIVFYGIFVTLFAYRIFFLPVHEAEMNPLFWVVMGAAAIATNAGSTLILTRPDLPFLLAMRPFVNGTTLILWAWATWWIPLLAIFGVWRHLVRRYPLTYAPMYWSLVFPLGMYAVATYRLSLASDFKPIEIFSQGMVWIALAAWLATMAGLLVSLRASVQAAGPTLR
ncbi:MAG TPA: tellurite resistance/C4-dicarboxylate transporter family protein [Gaiella sp.]|nr:tellurite resistance/C4-dicarboxylate transporter family protein [Gaiella sp.]